MGDEHKEFMLNLEKRSYRCLQQMAKSMGLPSNYKKFYLIELIHAKKFLSEDVVKTIIQKVKLERLLSSSNRLKNKKQMFSLTPRSKSPSITTTPKCPKIYLSDPEVQRALVKSNSRRSLLNDIEQHNNTHKPSDRVLRSFNLKTNRTLNYKIYMSAKCVMKNNRPVILNTSSTSETIKPMVLIEKEQVQNNYVAARRKRTVSGIYPLMLHKSYPQNVLTTEGIVIRKNDGSVTKINAFIQKSNTNYKQRVTYCNKVTNIQDILDSIDNNNIENTNSDMQIHPAIESGETIPPQGVLNPQMGNNFSHNERNAYSNSLLDDLDGIRQQMNYEQEHTNEQQRLPKINAVFSKFKDVIDVVQPIYVQVSTESELSRNYPDSSTCNTGLLESLYNFKSHMLTNVPLLQIATTANTKTVFSTSTMTTAMAHQSTASFGTDAYNDYNLFEQDNRYAIEENPSLRELNKYSVQMQQNTGSSMLLSASPETWQERGTPDTWQERGTPATVPEMMEDAEEIISQDGNYMEQIGLDVRVSCALCAWAGPRVSLENHIQSEHADEIVEVRDGEWCASWSLGALAQAERARVLRYDSTLYVLRAQYHDPERVAASLWSISADPAPKLGVITVYNKLSGEPYTWTGYIQGISNVDESKGLQVDISHLDLLPNSANLKLLNRELVSDSLNKVIVGAPILNDISIVMFVNII